MKVAGNTSDGDFIFGRGLASYKSKSEAIRQNVVTRLRLFTDDWFMNIESGNPWNELFGGKASKDKIKRQIERSVMTTDGVRQLNSLETIENKNDRKLTVIVSYTDIFDVEFNENFTLEG